MIRIPHDLILHSGPPPFPGWWRIKPAIPVEAICEKWSWWDGENYSAVVLPFDPPAHVAYFATVKMHKSLSPFVQWCWYWPKEARVERTEPPRLKWKKS